jgi:hypothetical protein
MVRLRRKDCSSFQVPAAAEVLEVRSLLSGAAAAVHSAAHHALAAGHAPAGAGAAPAAGKTMSTQYDVTVQFPAFFIPGNNPPFQVPGLLAITPVSTTVGSHVQVAVRSSITVFGLPALVDVSLKGKVLSSSSNGLTTTVNLAPTGTLKFTANISGHIRTSTFRAIAPMTITLDDTGQFTLVETDFKVPPSHGVTKPPITFLAYTA